MKAQVVDGHVYYVIESPKDLHGWEVLWEEPYKEGVKRLHLRTNCSHSPPEFRMAYCKDSIPILQTVETNA